MLLISASYVNVVFFLSLWDFETDWYAVDFTY